MKTNLGRLGMVVIGMVLAACGGSRDEAEGADAISGMSAPSAAAATLKSEVLACDAKLEEAEARASLDAAGDCYKGVVDGHAAEIDNLRKRNGGIQLAPPTLKAKTAFDDFRANRSSTGRASTQLCAELSLASSNFGGTLQQLEDAGCVVDVEQDLARLVLSEADVPGGNVPLTATASDAEIAEFVDRIVAQIERNIAGTDEAKAKAELEGVIAGYKQAATDLCSVLEDAGQSGGGTMEPVLVASCLDKARGLLAIELKMVAAAADLAASQ